MSFGTLEAFSFSYLLFHTSHILTHKSFNACHLIQLPLDYNLHSCMGDHFCFLAHAGALDKIDIYVTSGGLLACYLKSPSFSLTFPTEWLLCLRAAGIGSPAAGVSPSFAPATWEAHISTLFDGDLSKWVSFALYWSFSGATWCHLLGVACLVLPSHLEGVLRVVRVLCPLWLEGAAFVART